MIAARTTELRPRGSARRALALTVWAALAGSRPLLGAGDLDAALELARQGQAEQAEALVKKILAAPSSSAADRAAVDLVRAEILLAKALVVTGLDDYLKLVDESANGLRAYLEAQPASMHAGEARRGIDWRLHAKAERVALAARAVEDAKVRAGLEKRARELYETLDRHLQDRLRGLRAPKSPAEEEELMELRLDSARSLLERARVPGTSESDRRSVLIDAVDRLQELQFDLGQETAAFEALRLEGLCHVERRDFELARDRFIGAMTLRQRLRTAGKEPDEEELGIIRGSALSLCDLHLEGGQAREAAAVADRALGEDPQLGSSPAGLALKLQKAEALYQLRQETEAQALATQVANGDPGGRVGASAREKLRSWSTGRSGSGVLETPERWLALASAAQENEDWPAALQALRCAIEAARTPADRARHAAEAGFRLGVTYARMGRNHEAAAAFTDFFTERPAHEWAPRACFEAVRALGAEFASSQDARDEAARDRLLALLKSRWPDHPAAKNVLVLEAERLERDRRYREAAELYGKVPADAEAWENALVGAGRAYALEGSARWDKERGSRAAVEAFTLGRDALAKYFERARNPRFAPRTPELQKARASLTYMATQQLALILSQEAVGKPDEALQVLTEYARTLAQGDARLARVLSLQVKPYMATEREAEAVRVVDEILARFPDSPYGAQAARSCAIQLEATTETLVKAGGDPAAIAQNLKRIHVYYLKWFRDATARGARLSSSEVLSVGQSLLETALRQNGLDATVASLLEARRESLGEPGPVADAAQILAFAAEGKGGELSAGERLAALLALARCERLLAANVEGLEKARDRYTAIARTFDILDDQGAVQPTVATSPQGSTLITVCIELGAVQGRLAKAGQGALFEPAFLLFQEVAKSTESGSEGWWVAKYMALSVLCDKGTSDAVTSARVILGNTEKNFPDYDGDRFGMKPRFAAIKERLAKL